MQKQTFGYFLITPPYNAALANQQCDTQSYPMSTPTERFTDNGDGTDRTVDISHHTELELGRPRSLSSMFQPQSAHDNESCITSFVPHRGHVL
jgi:hypothetical protein